MLILGRTDRSVGEQVRWGSGLELALACHYRIAEESLSDDGGER